MTQRSISHGAREGFRFELAWEADEPHGTAAEATRGRLTLAFANAVFWGLSEPGKPTGFSWTWVDLLEHLAHNWTYLRWEETNPLGIHAPLETLRMRSEDRWSELNEQQRDAEEQQLHAFLESHDLAAGLHGAYPAALYWIKQGHQVRLSCKNRNHWTNAPEAFGTLTELGAAIADRLRDLSDERARNAVGAWDARDAVSPDRLLEVASSVPRAVLREIAGGRELDDYFEVEADVPESELLAAARMGYGEVAPNALRPVLERLRVAPHVLTEELDAFGTELRSEVASLNDAPHDQGYRAARWLRERLGLADASPVDVESLLRRWSIRVEDIEIQECRLDAICCWGPKRGPIILVNRRGPHGRGVGRRATLAHEVGHLLLDRHGALPLGEVLGGHAPVGVEARARAFAAELLLPRAIASHELAQVASVGDAKDIVMDLCKRFGVSREVTAWQTRNSGVRVSSDVHAYLRTLVSQRERF